RDRWLEPTWGRRRLHAVAMASHARGSPTVTPTQRAKLRLSARETLGALSPDFQTVATTQFAPQEQGDNPSGCGIVRLRDTRTSQVKRKWIVPGLLERDCVFEYAYTSLRFSPDGNGLAVANNDSEDHSFKLWNIPSGRAVRTL